MNHIMVGNLGEQYAAGYLSQVGYTILEKKYRLKIGEIDIIAKDNNTIVFVEVKTRRSTRCGLPAEAVTYQKQQKIKQVALCYLQQMKRPNVACRFDVMELLLLEESMVKCNHIIDAFQ